MSADSIMVWYSCQGLPANEQIITGDHMKIVLDHVTKRFPNRNRKIKTEVTAVSDIDLTVPDGMLVGLLGPSGCGKSTTLNLISGLEKPTEGRIFFGDEDVTDVAPQERGIGLVFQSYALYPHLSVFDNIKFPLENLRGKDRMTKEAMAERVKEVASLVMIDELMDRKPSELSGGQQQRVAIAWALVKSPKVLLLDEPLSNLDARLRLQTREEIRRIQQETGITTIFVTHDQEEAMSICDRIVVMKMAQIVQTGRGQDVYDDPQTLFVAKFLGTPPINVFSGRIENGMIRIGNDVIPAHFPGRDREVYVAIRPEGFIYDPDGPLTCRLIRCEVTGRDVSIVSENDAFLNESGLIRSITDASVAENVKGDTVRFSLKANKVFLFEKDTEERIRAEGQNGQV